jgi:hypothetical protein
MAPRCAEFGISQDRLQDLQPLQRLRRAGLTDRSRRPSPGDRLPAPLRRSSCT